MPKMLLKSAASNHDSAMKTKRDADSVLSVSVHSSSASQSDDSSKFVDNGNISSCTDMHTNKKKDDSTHFPQRLMEMLSNEEHSNIITWLPHGKSFLIIKKSKFITEVLPKYFKETQYASFTRKLTRWGFDRVNRGPETGAFYHRHFQKENILFEKLSCKSKKSIHSARKDAPVANSGVRNFPVNREEELSSVRTPSAASPFDSSFNSVARTFPVFREEEPSAVLMPPLTSPYEDNSRLLHLARGVKNNIHTIKQLTANIYEQNQSAWSNVSEIIPAMNPNSDFSISVVRAAEDALKRSINSNPSSQLQKNSHHMQNFPEQHLNLKATPLSSSNDLENAFARASAA